MAKELAEFIKRLENDCSLVSFYEQKPIIISKLKELGGIKILKPKTTKKEVGENGTD